MLQTLRADPLVQSVVADRIVRGHALVVRNGDALIPKPPAIRLQDANAAPQRTQTEASDDGDSYYTSPQGWAVRAVGGFGTGYAGGTMHGAWNTTLGTGVRIAVLDSGVDASHPDIAPHLGLNLSEVDRMTLPSACDDGTPQDQQGHGTWAASLAAGAMGAGTGRVVGVAPGATLLNIKVLQRMPGTGSTLAQQCANGQAAGLLSWVMQGIEDAIAQKADVISLSLGAMVDLYTGDGAGLKASFDRVTHEAAAAGIVIVAAMGNDGFDFSNTRYAELPAQSRDVLAVVAATNAACAENIAANARCIAGEVTLPYYSNRGANLNAVAAPGGSYPNGDNTSVSGWIMGACSSGKPGTVDGLPQDSGHSMGCFALGHTQYVQAMGTSASAPLVAGAAALVKSAHPAWDAARIASVLRGTATGEARLPYGLVNAEDALKAQ